MRAEVFGALCGRVVEPDRSHAFAIAVEAVRAASEPLPVLAELAQRLPPDYIEDLYVLAKQLADGGTWSQLLEVWLILLGQSAASDPGPAIRRSPRTVPGILADSW